MISTIKYKERSILYLDHSNKMGKELVQSIKDGNEAISKGFNILLLANFSGTYINEEVMRIIDSEESKKVNLNVAKTAVFGITGIKKIFVSAHDKIMKKKTGIFDTIEEAKNYLVS